MDGIPSCIPNSNANPVFSDHGDGTVTDNRTCLMWLKDADCVGQQAWTNVDTSAEVVGLINAASPDCADYMDDTYTDWRLPTIQELQSLVHYDYSSPAMSNAVGNSKWTTNGDAFSGVQTYYYWSSTTNADDLTTAWYVYLDSGYVSIYGKSLTNYVWPVRGGV
jgi:hypothetical protein